MARCETLAPLACHVGPCQQQQHQQQTDKTVFSHFLLPSLFGDCAQVLNRTQVDLRPWRTIFLPKQTHNILFTTFSSFHHRSEAGELDPSAAEHHLQHMLRHFYTSSCGLRIRVGTSQPTFFLPWWFGETFTSGEGGMQPGQI